MCFFGALFNPGSSHPGAHHRGVHAHIPDLRRNIQLSVAKNIPLPVFYSSTGETPKPVKRSSMDARASRLAFLLDLGCLNLCQHLETDFRSHVIQPFWAVAEACACQEPS